MNEIIHEADPGGRGAGRPVWAAAGLRHRALAAQHIRLAAAEIPGDVDPATRTALKEAVERSYLDAFRLMMLICAGLALASAASAWALVEGRRAGVAPEPAG